jgi:hypothetical protein
MGFWRSELLISKLPPICCNCDHSKQCQGPPYVKHGKTAKCTGGDVAVSEIHKMPVIVQFVYEYQITLLPTVGKIVTESSVSRLFRSELDNGHQVAVLPVEEKQGSV